MLNSMYTCSVWCFNAILIVPFSSRMSFTGSQWSTLNQNSCPSWMNTLQHFWPFSSPKVELWGLGCRVSYSRYFFNHFSINILFQEFFLLTCFNVILLSALQHFLIDKYEIVKDLPECIVCSQLVAG